MCGTRRIGNKRRGINFGRQGCPSSALLFNVVMADLEEKISRVKWDWVRLEGDRIYSMTCK